MKIKKMVAVAFSICLLFANFAIQVSAASYPSDYRYWSQGASDYSWMCEQGCFIVAEAKLIYESGINNSNSFNPDVLYEWKTNGGYSNGPSIPQQYATSIGKTLTYHGKTTTSMENKIWNNISNGYYTLVCVLTTDGNPHYVMIANSLSSQNGSLYCYNSYDNSNSADPSTISSRGYTLTDVYTYSVSDENLVSVTSYDSKNTITDTNAVLWGWVYKPSSYAVTKIGIKVRPDGGSYTDSWSLYQTPSQSYTGETEMCPWFDLNAELGITLTHATKYYYKFYAVVNGTEYWSDELSFTTTGSHSYSIQQYESAHPHKYYKKCSCGDYYYTGETATLSDCSECTPTLTIIYNANGGYISEEKSSENYLDTDNLVRKISTDSYYSSNWKYGTTYSNGLIDDTTFGIVKDGYSFAGWSLSSSGGTVYDKTTARNPEDIYPDLVNGDATITMYAVWEEDEAVLYRYYDWTFDFDNAMKLISDAMISDGDLTLAANALNKGLIASVEVYKEEEVISPEAPDRPGYRFVGWETLLEPSESVYDVTYAFYIIQAQYEPLLYSKGECIYGDINFDNKISVADLIRLKKMIAGTEETHVSADLDANDNTDAADVSLLKKLLLGFVISENVYFDANGGNVSETQRLVICGQSLGELPIPTRTGYDFLGWYSNDGTEITSDTIMASGNDITAVAHWLIKSYKISWSSGTGYTVTVKRTSSPYANASVGTLSSGDDIYYGDLLSISYSAKAGYTLTKTGLTSVTVNEDITSSDIYAEASANSYTYSIVYKSSNGTSLGTSTATYKYGTTNTVYPKSIPGYTTPPSQTVPWDSVSAKTITFIYTPASVSTSQNLSSGAWAIDGSTNYITYTVKAEYRNRTSNSIQIRVIWTNTLIANYYYQRGQVFNATIGGTSTGNVTIVPYNTWLNSSSSARSLSGTSDWITVSVSATQTSVSISADAYRQHSDGTLVDINESFSKTFSIPTY